MVYLYTFIPVYLYRCTSVCVYPTQCGPCDCGEIYRGLIGGNLTGRERESQLCVPWLYSYRPTGWLGRGL